MAATMQGKVALITGGGSGIGRATAFRLAREGVRVMIADYVPEGAERVVKAIKESGGDASCVGADVAITKQVEMMVNQTVATYGRLDYAFNNAGIEGTMADTASYPIFHDVAIIALCQRLNAILEPDVAQSLLTES